MDVSDRQSENLFSRLEVDAPNFYRWLQDTHESLTVVPGSDSVPDGKDYRFSLVGTFKDCSDETKVRIKSSSSFSPHGYGLIVEVTHPSGSVVELVKRNDILSGGNLAIYLEEREGGPVVNYTGDGYPDTHGEYSVVFSDKTESSYLDVNAGKVIVPKGLESLAFNDLKNTLSESHRGIGGIGRAVEVTKIPSDTEIPFP